MKKITIARAGGGTGGHVFPIKSLIQYLSNNENYQSKIAQMYRCGTKGSLEEENCKELQNTVKNLTFLSLFSGKRRREKGLLALLKNMRDIFFFLIGCFQSLFYLLYYHIDVVFCKGGYVAFPVVCAAKLLRRKIIVHESDVHPGLVNRIASKFASKSFTGFDKVLANATTVGQILSTDLLPDVATPLSKKENQTQILIMGGSQGSKNLYESLSTILHQTPELKNCFFHIILGKLNQELAHLFAGLSNVQCYDFLSQKAMGTVYLNADIAVTRAGTTSLAEQELFDLKLIMIPIPWTHDQLDNAKWYVKHKNGILIEQDDPAFLEKLKKELLALQSYKKNLQSRKREEEINHAKEVILESFF